MKNRLWVAAAIVAAVSAAPAQNRRAHDYNLNITSSNVEHCSDLKVSSATGEVAQANDVVTLAPGQASAIELDDASNGVVQVRAWDRADYSVETCRIAVADTKAAASQIVSGIAVSHSAGRFSMSGPASADGNWQVYFLIRTPRNGNVDLQTKNGPVSVAGVNGSVKVRAINGPVSVSDTAGRVDVQSSNGPISFRGGAGDVHITAKNGPISLDLAGETWNGAQLEAHTDNGPVSLTVPENYRSSVRLQTSAHAPLSCKIDACSNVSTDASTNDRLIRINGAADTIRVSTTNGPVSINGPRRRAI